MTGSQPQPNKKNHHYLPQAYQRAWSLDGSNVLRYRLLVPSPRVPMWQPISVKTCGMEEYLYAQYRNGRLTTDMEDWLNEEIETPAAAPLARLRDGRELAQDEWHRVTRYLYLLDRRTPAAFIAHQREMEKHLPGLIRDVLLEAKKFTLAAERIQQAGRTFKWPRATEANAEFPLQVHIGADPSNPGKSLLGLKAVAGRSLWLNCLREDILRSRSHRAFLSLRWHVIKAPPGGEWFTTDRPLIRLQYWKPGEFDYAGAWARKGTELIAPISPTLLLYSKVGHPEFRPRGIDSDKAAEIQRVIAGGALRHIIACRETKRVEWLRPRHASLQDWRSEKKDWDDWNENNRKEETAERVTGNAETPFDLNWLPSIEQL